MDYKTSISSDGQFVGFAVWWYPNYLVPFGFVVLKKNTFGSVYSVSFQILLTWLMLKMLNLLVNSLNENVTSLYTQQLPISTQRK